MNSRHRAVLFATAAAGIALTGGHASAQGQAVDEVIVTARKQDETSLSVPVVLTAIGAKELERRNIKSMDTLSALVPGLVLGEGGGTAQGGNVVIRGLGGVDGNPSSDQAVAWDIDGVTIARATVRRLSQFDMEQITVLKGPQTLFFGRNSPGGVISIRTADPTAEFEAGATAGYEFIAHEKTLEGFISGPLVEGLGARLAVYGSDVRGWTKSDVPLTSPFYPSRGRYGPDRKEKGGRLTLLWQPVDRFSARAKLNFTESKGGGTYFNQQFISCPFGRPQPVAAGLVADCKADDHNQVGDPGAALGRLQPDYNDGKSFNHSDILLGGTELRYNVTDDLTLVSQTGYYRSRLKNLDNFTASYFAPTAGIALFLLRIREVSQELRLNSSFSGPLNFTLGGYYQDTEVMSSTRTAFNANAPIGGTQSRFLQDGRAASVFAQVRWDITPELELAGGGRFSHESKRIPLALRFFPIGSPVTGFSAGVPQVITPQKAKWDDFSPEITLSWRPSETLTVFGGYRKGFLAGGFNTQTDFTNIAYDPETVRGFEGGVKSLLLDGALRIDAAVYHYKMKDYQVAVPTTEITPAGPIQTQRLANAGGAKFQGFEVSVTYNTPVEGLRLNGALNYNRARYTNYLAGCYRAQSFEAGCINRINPVNGNFSLLQDLGGEPVARSPDWTANAGFDWETSIGSNLKLGVSGNISYSSSFWAATDNIPGSKQDGFFLVDSGIRIGAKDDKWRVALLGRNLGNEYYFTRALPESFTGSVPGLAAANSIPADIMGEVSRGREIWVQLSGRF